MPDVDEDEEQRLNTRYWGEIGSDDDSSDESEPEVRHTHSSIFMLKRPTGRFVFHTYFFPSFFLVLGAFFSLIYYCFQEEEEGEDREKADMDGLQTPMTDGFATPSGKERGSRRG